MAPEDVDPVRWTGRQALVALPEHIDTSNAGQIREQLLSVIDQGAETLIVDMTATISCDHAGGDAMARAYQRAVADHTELRLVVTSAVVLRMLGMTDIGRLVPVYPSVATALAVRSLAASAALTSPQGGRAAGASLGGPVPSDVGVEVALLDRDGVITWVNAAWQDFAAANGGDPARTGTGVSYLQACAGAGNDPVVDEVAGAIRAALVGDLPGPVTVDVPCHSPATERWFDILISSRFDDEGRCAGATVTLSLARSQPRSQPRSQARPRPGSHLRSRPGPAQTRPVAAVFPGVLWNMVEAFSDGVALADGQGTLVLASRRLEDMFGYPPTELTGQPLERLIPAHLQAARVRPVGTGALLTGLHKDGTTFPVEISLSPVPTAAGRFSMAVVRDMTAVRRLHRGQEILDTVITSLFRVGVSLQAAADLPGAAGQPHLDEALRILDGTISQIRDSMFADRQQ
jgi:anti-anti-sigma factor